jgi:hypothetical protein
MRRRSPRQRIRTIDEVRHLSGLAKANDTNRHTVKRPMSKLPTSVAELNMLLKLEDYDAPSLAANDIDEG